MSGYQSIAPLRMRRGFTQQELADSIGVSRGAIARVEIGTLPMSDKILRGVARVLGLPVEDLEKYIAGELSAEDVIPLMNPKSLSQREIEDEQAVNAALTVSTLIVDGFKRANATLEQLDTVRRWFNAMGPVVPVAHALSASRAAADAVVDEMFNEARISHPSHTSSSLALLRALLRKLSAEK